jgi:hypothetical protein
MNQQQQHYPTRSFVTSLNNTLLLHKINPAKRCLKTELAHFKDGSVNAVTFHQINILLVLDNCPDLEHNTTAFNLLEEAYNNQY